MKKWFYSQQLITIDLWQIGSIMQKNHNWLKLVYWVAVFRIVNLKKTCINLPIPILNKCDQLLLFMKSSKASYFDYYFEKVYFYPRVEPSLFGHGHQWNFATSSSDWSSDASLCQRLFHQRIWHEEGNASSHPGCWNSHGPKVLPWTWKVQPRALYKGKQG